MNTLKLVLQGGYGEGWNKLPGDDAREEKRAGYTVQPQADA